MTRSFSDMLATSVAVTARPVIEEHEITKDSQFIILGSDGIWESIESQEAVDIAAKATSAKDAAKLL